jgi:hypothetical protein
MSSSPLKLNVGAAEFAANETMTASLPFPVRLIDLSLDSRPENPNECVGVQQGRPIAETLAAMAASGIWSVVQSTQPNLEVRLKMAAAALQKPDKFFTAPMASFFVRGPMKTPVEKRFEIRSSSQREFVLNQISQFLAEFQSAKQSLENALSVASELINAVIYGTPFASATDKVSEDSVVVLDPDMAAQLIVAYNNDHLFIGCIEAFGTLDCEALIEKAASLVKNANRAGDKKTDSPRNLLLSLSEHSSSITMIVEKANRSMIGCVIPIQKTFKSQVEMTRDFSIKSYTRFTTDGCVFNVERRKSELFIGITGSIDESVPYQHVDSNNVKKTTIDMHLVQNISAPGIERLIKILRGASADAEVIFEYVPSHLAAMILEVEKVTGPSVRVRSLIQSAKCNSCGAQEQIVCRRQTSAGDSNSSFLCSSCHSPLTLT